MGLFSRKESALDRRMKALDKELAKIQGNIKAVARGASSGKAASMPPPVAAHKMPESAHADAAQDQAESSVAAPSQPEQQNTFFAHLPGPGAASGVSTQGEPDLFTPAGAKQADDELSNRHRFANYFMAGHFHDLRPVRHEQRVQRNKTIVNVIVTLLVLIWLLFWFLW